MRNFPGRAVDASLAIDQKSPMERIYQNNWLNADKTIRTIGRSSKLSVSNGNGSSGSSTHSDATESTFRNGSGGIRGGRNRSSISSLGKYQLTLEQMRELDVEQSKRAFQTKQFATNGYSPSALRQKNRDHYDEWDVDDDDGDCGGSGSSEGKTIRRQKISDNSISAINRSEQRVCADDHHNHTINRIPKIKRAQTMRCANSNGNDTSALAPTKFNIQNLFRSTTNGSTAKSMNDDDSMAFKTATINKKNFNRMLRNNLVNAMQNEEVCDVTTPNRNRLSNGHNGRATIRESLRSNRGDCQNANCDERTNGQVNDKAIDSSQLLRRNEKPAKLVLRAKSVRINPTPFADTKYDNGDDIDDEQLRRSVATNGERKRPTSMNNLNLTLPRLPSIMKRRPTAATAEVMSRRSSTIAEQQPTPKSISTSTSSLSSTVSSCDEECQRPVTVNRTDFVIPRPRLIVPVHTYARKRRTGNLNASRGYSHADDDEGGDIVDKQPRSTSNGKNFFRSTGKKSIILCLI